MRFLIFALVLASASACAQSTPEAPTEALDLRDHTTIRTADATPEAPLSEGSGSAEESDAEAAVRAIVAGDGVHVVHFWAPWCGNSINELRSGIAEVVDANPDVTFTYVTVRNDGEDGASTLARYGVPERVEVLAHPGGKPVVFLGRPITWTPTTWVFNRNGTLAYAFNYGEVSPALLSQAIADAQSDWHHD